MNGTIDLAAAVNAAATETTPAVRRGDILDELGGSIARVRAVAAEFGMDAADRVKQLIRAAEVRWMLCEWPTLDTSVMDAAEQTRYVRRDETGNALHPAFVPAGPDTHEVRVPVYVTLASGVDRWLSTGRFERAFQTGDGNAHQIRVGAVPRSRAGNRWLPELRVTARVAPPEGATVYAGRVRNCWADMVDFYTALLRAGVTNSPYTGTRNDEVTVRVLWAPADDAWVVAGQPRRPAGDPAVLLRTEAATYLVALYDIPSEKPIDNIVREFTTGKLPRKGA